MIFLIFIQSLLAQTPFCQKNLTSKSYLKTQAVIDKKISQSANLVSIAEQADKVMGQLLEAKNLILIKWLRERGLMSSSEEAIASKWRIYYLEEFILKKFPTPKPRVNLSVENLFAEIDKISFTPSVKKRLSKAFNQARLEAIKQIRAWPLDKTSQKNMILRLNEVKLKWFEKIKGSGFQNRPFEFLTRNLIYDPKLNRISPGVPILLDQRKESLFIIFLQGLGSIFSPDHWPEFSKTQYPFTPVQSCLKKNFENPDKKELEKIFSHWFSAEIFAKSPFMEDFSSERYSFCTTSLKKTERPLSVLNDSSNSKDSLYVKQIYISQPQIRKMLMESRQDIFPFSDNSIKNRKFVSAPADRNSTKDSGPSFFDFLYKDLLSQLNSPYKKNKDSGNAKGQEQHNHCPMVFDDFGKNKF